MIPSRIKAYMMFFLLLPLFFLMLNCASSKQIHPKNVYFHPTADFSKYKRIAIFLDFNQLPEERREGILFSFIKEELEKSGYDVLSKAYSIKNLSDLETLFKIRDKLNISAIVKYKVDRYDFKKEKKKSVEPFLSGIVETLPVQSIQKEKALFIFDFSMRLEMIEAQQGNEVWSCSLSCERQKVEGDRRELLRQMIKNCVRTIPNKFLAE